MSRQKPGIGLVAERPAARVLSASYRSGPIASASSPACATPACCCAHSQVPTLAKWLLAIPAHAVPELLAPALVPACSFGSCWEAATGQSRSQRRGLARQWCPQLARPGPQRLVLLASEVGGPVGAGTTIPMIRLVHARSLPAPPAIGRPLLQTGGAGAAPGACQRGRGAMGSCAPCGPRK